MELKETMLSRKEIYSGRVFRVTRDEILLPDGAGGFGNWSIPMAAW